MYAAAFGLRTFYVRSDLCDHLAMSLTQPPSLSPANSRAAISFTSTIFIARLYDVSEIKAMLDC